MKPVYVITNARRGTGTSDFVSEGLALLSHSRYKNVVMSSDYLGPTWFSEGPAAKVEIVDGLKKGKALSYCDMERSSMPSSNTYLNPRWVLSENACYMLTNFKFIKHAPLLTILNAFEDAINNTVKSAAAAASAIGVGKKDGGIELGRLRGTTGVGVIDATLMRENGASLQELVVGRFRRCVALFCYTLIETLLWKSKIINVNPTNFTSIPFSVGYGELAVSIKKRCDEFIRGEGEQTIDDSGEYAIPSITTFVALAASGQLAPPNFPKIVGSFYEVVLGRSIMTRLNAVVAGEYIHLINTVERMAPLSSHHRLERLVEGEVPATGKSAITEHELRWVELEKERRRNKRTSQQAAMEMSVPSRAVIIRPLLNRDKDILETGALQSLYEELLHERFENDPSEAVKRLFTGRKILHENFKVSFNPFFSFYTLWNWMFIATGALFNTSPNPITKNILVNVLAKDMHALLLCNICHTGFVYKVNETCRAYEQTKAGKSSLLMSLEDAYYTLNKKNLGRDNKMGRDEAMSKAVNAILSTGRDIVEADREIEAMDVMTLRSYSARAINASNGFAVLGLFSLFYSVNTDNLANSDLEVIDLLNRWTVSSNIFYNTAKRFTIEDKEGGQDSGRRNLTNIIAFIGVWALRNAVRARRNVQDIEYSKPGAPMPLSSVMPQLSPGALSELRFIKDFGGEFVRTIGKFIHEIGCANTSKRINVSANPEKNYHKFGKMLDSTRAVEPLGQYKLNDKLKTGYLSPGGKKNISSSFLKPSLGEVTFTLDELKSVNKEKHANLTLFSPYSI